MGLLSAPSRVDQALRGVPRPRVEIRWIAQVRCVLPDAAGACRERDSRLGSRGSHLGSGGSHLRLLTVWTDRLPLSRSHQALSHLALSRRHLPGARPGFLPLSPLSLRHSHLRRAPLGRRTDRVGGRRRRRARVGYPHAPLPVRALALSGSPRWFDVAGAGFPRLRLCARGGSAKWDCMQEGER